MSSKKRALILINKTAGTGKAGNDALDIATAVAKKGYEPVVYPIIPGSEFSSERLVAEYKSCSDSNKE